MRLLIIILLSFLFLFACKETYVSPYNSPNLGYLVVEGVINSGLGKTTIKLSRTSPLTDGTYTIETGASVIVMDQNNRAYPLSETVAGQYTADGLNLDPDLKYRLQIGAAGKEYISDYVAVNDNPPIDTLSWNYASDGLHIAVNTHDPQNKAKYFQWDYVATWEIHSAYIPATKYSNSDPYFVTYFDPIKYWMNDSSKYKCWQSETSQQFILGSSIKYSIDTLSNPLTVIEPGSAKLSVLYSINVRQYAYSKQGYEFLQKMKRNSEQLGSVFDAQPSDVQGNIHCVSQPHEIVIGYVSSCPIQEKRSYIRNADIPGWNYVTGCSMMVQNNDSAFIRDNDYYPDGATPHILPVNYITRNPSTPPPNGVIFTFTAADIGCVDCRLRGTITKPDFWP
ncbi:MAG TPA: DUF4249 domain-containing protein [Puia sp.]|nr:DUF4249 domain-containing protein [Puia sp.]